MREKCCKNVHLQIVLHISIQIALREMRAAFRKAKWNIAQGQRQITFERFIGNGKSEKERMEKNRFKAINAMKGNRKC